MNYICELPDGSLRDSTPEEIAEALKVQAWLKELHTQRMELEKEVLALHLACKHLACTDLFGHIWTTRTCTACGWSDHL